MQLSSSKTHDKTDTLLTVRELFFRVEVFFLFFIMILNFVVVLFQTLSKIKGSVKSKAD